MADGRPTTWTAIALSCQDIHSAQAIQKGRYRAHYTITAWLGPGSHFRFFTWSTGP